MHEDSRLVIRNFIVSLCGDPWRSELDQAASKYHITVLWVAVIFDPIFGIIDYINIPDSWKLLLSIRIGVSFITLVMLVTRKRFSLPSYFMVMVTFFMISIQNAYTYRLIGNESLLGQNLNYMALLIGAAMFLVWPWFYSAVVVMISAAATALFINTNPALDGYEFFLNGGLLLGASAIFMIVLIRTRYNLTLLELQARRALKASNEEIQSQAEEIKGINDNLEMLVKERTAELERKNKALEEYAFINAHKLRSPVASILGLINLMNKTEVNDEVKKIIYHLQDSTEKLDAVVSTITKAIERGD